MIRRMIVLAVLATARVTGAAHAASAPDCASRASEILTALTHGHGDDATAYFDATMRAHLGGKQLDQIWSKLLPAQYGAYQSAQATRIGHAGGMTIATTPLEFASGWINLRVACNADGSVGGLFFRPGEAPKVAPTTTPTASVGVHHRDLALATSSPLGPLPGTLTLPKGAGPFPTVLLVAGSGPNDRDETIGPNKPLRDIAVQLARDDIASYRYDKRSRVYGAEMAGKSIGIDDEVTADAVAALKRLAQQPEVDPARLFVLGHSLGALMAPRITARYPSLAGVVLLAAPAKLGLDTVIRQIRYVAGTRKLPKAKLDAELAPILKARAKLAHADRSDPPQGLFFHAPASYWLSLRDYDPIATAKHLPQPMLILQGGGDYQVTPHGDFAKWQAAFADSPRVTLHEFPGLSHIFMPAGNPPSPADYARAGHVDADVTTTIANWIDHQGQR